MEIKDKDDRVGKLLNDKIKEWLLYVGFASAVISIFGYIAITVVMITGFKSEFELQNQILFSLVGAGVGLVITFALRYQGIAFAKAETDSKSVMKSYYEAMNKNKKEKDLKDINYYMIKATIIDVLIKGVIFIIITTLIIDLFSKGNGDWSLIWLMLFNILMFTGFGLMAIAKSYDHYIEQHIPVIVERTRKLNNPSVGVEWKDVKEKLDITQTGKAEFEATIGGDVKVVKVEGANEFERDFTCEICGSDLVDLAGYRFVCSNDKCINRAVAIRSHNERFPDNQLPFAELDKDYSKGEVE